MTAKARLLVIDDDRSTVMVMKRLLGKRGYDVSVTLDGLTGLEKAREEKPDLIILDVMMPKMDGYEVAECLQSDNRTANIPILMLTGKVVGAEKATRRTRGFEAGATDFLAKPVKAQVLVKRVKALLWAARP